MIPGVLRQDVHPPVPPAFRTGVPAFVVPGAVDGAVDFPTLLQVRRPATLTARSGAAPGPLGDAVAAFFGNGGELCWVVGFDPALPLADGVQQALDALDTLESLTDVDLVCLPGVPGDGGDGGDGVSDAEAAAVQRLVLGHCARRGDLFAILDGPSSPAPRDAVTHREALAPAGPDGGWGALYYPWLGVPGSGGTLRRVAPSGAVAGLYARTDALTGVHRAPANLPLAGVLDVLAVPTAAELDELAGLGVNVVRALPGRGIRVWGARTLSDARTGDVGARRTLVTIGRWVERYLGGLAFEPNDIRLWVRVMRELTAYLEDLHRAGALRGADPEQAFYVKCDDETNPRELRETGVAVTEIGVALTAPAEFVVVRVVHGASGVSVVSA